MRIRLFPVLAGICAVIGSVTGCDNGEVLLDKAEKSIETDTTMRVMDCVYDSASIAINTNASWEAFVATKGKEWCFLSKSSGVAGRDTIKITVAENPTDSIRRTSVILESGSNRIIFRVMQKAGEPWFGTYYWRRTALQKAGISGKVETMSSTSRKRPGQELIYNFDRNGNLTLMNIHDLDHNRMDSSYVYTYDDMNHRLTCAVVRAEGDTVRNWSYEYENTGMLVTYSARGWEEQNPLDESLEGMVVPGLSGVHKTWRKGEFMYGEDRAYKFENEGGKLVIKRALWRERIGTDEHENLGGDTLRVEYRKGLPYNSRFVSNSLYYDNGMLKMVDKVDCRYEFGVKNVQVMVPTYYIYKGGDEHLIDSCIYSYNMNRDLLERRVYYNGYDGATVETYGPYTYDNVNNWNDRLETVPRAGSSEAQPDYVHRTFYYR